MDVYVVLLDDVVIGAATELDGAQDIGDRRWEYEGFDRLTGDRQWLHDPETKSWSRTLAGRAQIIVRVPLAGTITFDFADAAETLSQAHGRVFGHSKIEEIGRQFGAP